MPATNMSSLECLQTEELIAELFKRKTFVGVIVYSPHTHRFDGQAHQNFVLKSTCDDESTMIVLQAGMDVIENRIQGSK